MKKIIHKLGFILIIVLLIAFQSCDEQGYKVPSTPVDWESRTIDYRISDSMESGTTYLSIFPKINSQIGKKIGHGLTVTVNMRNISETDTVYIHRAEYYGTKGNSIKTYFDKTIYITPLETIEIVIDEQAKEGGTGDNFIFDWEIKPNSIEPLFEGVMVSTTGQQGLSFTTQGIRIK